MLKAAIGILAARPRLRGAIRRVTRAIPGLQPFLRRRLAAAQPQAAAVPIEVDGVITLEGLCQLSRQI